MNSTNSSDATQPADSSKPQINSYPSWGPRFWHGMRLPVWLRLLASNQFRVSASRAHIAIGATFFTPINDLLAFLQWLVFSRKIRAAELKQPPIFILGHWRSGTTFLHELMAVDPQFASPITYQCFAPSHHLVSEYLMVRFGGFMLPKKRPMDQMDAGWRLPQEDEFAMMNLGAPTPYLRMAFPNTQPKWLELLAMEDVSEPDLARWRETFKWFVQTLAVRYPEQRLVMKSPPHTGRLAELSRMFPDAKFVHLTRDPCKLYSSTIRLWRSLDEVQSLQKPDENYDLEGYVAECLDRMYAGFESARSQVAPEQIIDIKYEDLVAAPEETLRRVYQHLELGDFQSIEAALGERLAEHSSYQTNKHDISPELKRKILDRWADYAHRYGYA